MSARLVRAAFDTLELRRLLSVTTLSNGFGDGSMSVAVDSYGAFGIVPVGQPLQYGDRTPGNLGEVNKSFVYFTPVKQFLTSGSTVPIDGNGFPYFDPLTGLPTFAGYSSSLPDEAFDTTSPQSAVSTFILSGTDATGKAFDYQVELTQTLGSVTPTQRGRYVADDTVNTVQSTLTQSYRITNLLGTANSFSVARYLEMRPDASIFFTTTEQPTFGDYNVAYDGGRTLVAAGTGGIFALDSTASNFVQIRSSGGTFDTAAIQKQGLDGAIIVNNGLTPAISGVLGDTGTGLAKVAGTDIFTGSAVATPAFYAGLAQQYNYVIGPRETVEFITTTTLGQDIPVQLTNTIAVEEAAAFPVIPPFPPVVPTLVPIAGDFGFESSVYNYGFPVDSTGTTQPLNVTINRLGGSTGAATVQVTPISVTSNLAGVSLASPTTVSFLDGQTSVTVPITITAAAGVDATSFQLVLGNPSAGSAVTGPGVATVNVLPQLPVFRATQTAATSNSLTIQVTRTGNINGPASVTVSTSNGTALAGTDYTALSQRLDFADGETTKDITLKLDRKRGITSATVLLNLVAVPTNGILPLTPTTPVTLTFSSTDGVAPTVSKFSTVTGSRGIEALDLTFSEALNGPGDFTVYSLAQRSGEGVAGAASKVKGLALSSISYDPNTHVIRLTPKSPLKLNTNYQITVRPSPLLTDLTGNQLNQDPASGVSSYTRYFARGTKVAYTDQTGDVVSLSIKKGSFEVVRFTNGEAATVTLFGQGTATSLLTGNVKGPRKTFGSTSIGAILNANSSTVFLPLDRFNIASTVA